MKKFFIAFILLVCSVFALCGAEITVAEWDFTKTSVTQNKIPVALRGKSKITKAGLDIPSGAPKDRIGAATTKVFPALSPEGAFSVSVNFTLSSKAPRKGGYHVILDNKYIPATTAKQTAQNYGFMLMLKHVKGNTFIPSAAFGYQKLSRVVTGKPVAITFDKPHNIRLIYDAKGNVKIMLDNRAIVAGKVQSGRISPAKLALHFGSRAGADYWSLGGTISKVTFKKTVIPPKKLRPGTTIASWNFTNANVTKSKFPVKMRGGRVTPNGMAVTNRAPTVPCGAVGTKAFPELSPQQGFEINAEIVLDAKFPRDNNKYAMIFDSKYTDNAGFSFHLAAQPKKRFRLVGTFGFGNQTVKVMSKEFTPTFGKVEKVGMRFTSIGQVVFYFRGAELNTETVPTGKIAESKRAPAFGDRIGKLYWPLGGSLKSVTIVAR